jgi:hypothetical protein
MQAKLKVQRYLLRESLLKTNFIIKGLGGKRIISTATTQSLPLLLQVSLLRQRPVLH